MEWKVYLDGEEPDLARLGQLTSDEVAIRLDDSGWYLQSEQFEVLADADDVGLGANALLAQINGVATLMIGGYRRVGPAGRIVRGSSAFIFVDDHIRIVCDVTANGVVTDSDGRVKVSADDRAPMLRAIHAAETNPVVAEVYRILGASTYPVGWVELYKAWELLRKAAGGEAALERVTGVPKERFKLIGLNSNHPDLHGDASRHAVPQQGRSPSHDDKITLGEGQAIVNELIEGYVKSAGR